MTPVESTLPSINIKEVITRIRAAKIKDEMRVFMAMAQGNANAALLLRRLIIWSGSKTAKKNDGWFYKTADDWFAETGLSRYRLENAIETLTGTADAPGVGLETEVRRIKLRYAYAIGKPIKHYRLDAKNFYDVLTKVIDALKTPIPARSDVEKPHSGMLKSSIPPCGKAASLGAVKPQMNPVFIFQSLSNQLGLAVDPIQSGEGQQPGAEEALDAVPQDVDRRTDLLDLYSGYFGICFNPAIVNGYVAVLGFETARQVMENCKNSDRAKTEKVEWGYVIIALKNAVELKNRPPQTTPAPPPPPVPRPPSPIVADGSLPDWMTGEPGQKMHEADLSPEQRHWQTAYQQLELQLDRASFDTWLRGAKFRQVDGGVYVIDVKSDYAAEMCQHRLGRTIRRVLESATGIDGVQTRFEMTGQGVQA